MIKQLLLLSVMLMSNAVCAADPDAEDGELLGLMLGATITPRTMTSEIVAQCVKRVPKLQNAGEATLARWDRKNAGYEAQASVIAEQLARRLALRVGKSQTSAAVAQTTTRTRETATSAAGEFISKLVDGMPREKQQQRCLNMFAAVDAGKMDIPTNQPSAYKIILNAR